MKHLILIAAAFLISATASASNQDIYRLSVEVTDMIYSHKQELSPQQKQQIEDSFQNIKDVLDGRPNLNCDTKQNVYREAFQWARSTEGLNTYKSEAMEFAETVSSKGCPLQYFESYSSSFVWARSSNGLNTYKSKAMEFATQISEFNQSNEYTQNVLECIRPEFDFARSSSGLNLPRDAAEAFAKKQCGMTE